MDAITPVSYTHLNEIEKPEDVVKESYVLEFLGLPDDKPIMESDLEKALVRHIENFLLELGKGFMFVGTQQRVTLFNTHYLSLIHICNIQ